MRNVKELVESGQLTFVPPNYIFHDINDEVDLGISKGDETIPTIDFSLLTSTSPDQRSKAIHDLGYACREWGFFIVINHGVQNELMDEMISACEGFFNLTTEEKREYQGNQLFDPIRAGTSFNLKVDDGYLLWRDYLKIHVHPNFDAPCKPPHFREVLQGYCEKAREMVGALLGGISQSLGMEPSCIKKAMEMETGGGGRHHQLLVANLYPPCPQPEAVMGLPPHSDHGLLTLLFHNHIDGLQLRHSGYWVPVHSPPYSFIVNIGDHMEILTNGKYKSVVHRAVVNNKLTRISIGLAHGPPLDTVFGPAPQILDQAGHGQRQPLFRSIKYREYMELQQSKRLNGKSCLESLRI